MLEVVLRLLAEMGPAAAWIAVFMAVVVTAFVLYVGVAMAATLAARDADQAKIRYRVFKDLLRLFHRRGQ